MKGKDIVFFTGKHRNPEDPFAGFGKKRSVYYDFFKRGTELGHRMFLTNGRDTHLKKDLFRDVLFFAECGKFVQWKDIVNADAVLDRSALTSFPVQESRITLNNMDFKRLCSDKLNMDNLLKEYMPNSHKVTLPSTFPKGESGKQYVLKPVRGLGGKGIFFGTCEELSKKYKELYAVGKTEYLLQEFIETNKGIRGITAGRHDLRVVLIGGVVRWVTVRTPTADSLCANVAQGGSIQDITNLEIPQEIAHMAKEVAALIESKYGKHLVYSIDFGMTEDGPFVFEINDQIGFPSEEMPVNKTFIGSLLQELINLSDSQ